MYPQCSPSENDLEPILFELANGVHVKVTMGNRWCNLNPRYNDKTLCFAIRVYSDENTYPRRLVNFSEFVAGYRYDVSDADRIWRSLNHHAHSRECLNHEDMEDFINHIESVIDEIQYQPEDITTHYQRSPSLEREFYGFDPIDDSVSNDQSD